MDLRPGRSFVEYAVSRGLQFFMISWRNPTAEQARLGPRHLRRARSPRDRRRPRDHAAATTSTCSRFCAGGILADDGAQPPRRRPATTRVHSASFGVTLLDFDVPRADRHVLRAAAARRSPGGSSQRRGILAGAHWATSFTWMRPERPGLELLGQQLPDGQRPAGVRHPRLERRRRPTCRRSCTTSSWTSSSNNLLARPGALTVLGTPVDLEPDHGRRPTSPARSPTT